MKIIISLFFMAGFSKYTMIELFEICKHIQYTPPNKPMEQWDNDDIYNSSLNILVNQPILLKCIDLVCSSMPPLKLFIKTSLKNYIKKYSAK
jgi:hypothetical protein